jgi:hypothetical protein
MSDTPIYDELNEPKDQPSKRPQPKVIAATIGAPVGVAVAEIGIWLTETATKIDIPATIETSITVVVSAGLAFVAGYFKRN